MTLENVFCIFKFIFYPLCLRSFYYNNAVNVSNLIKEKCMYTYSYTLYTLSSLCWIVVGCM